MTATISPEADKHPSFSYFSQDRNGLTEETNERGNLVVKGLKVFRTGSFRDSRGRKNNWTAQDLDKMVTHFSALRTNGLLVDVPVRTDHGESVNQIVGYFERIYREGELLLADIEFTEPSGKERWERKTFRSRSLEVGPYLSNDDELFYPVARGLAFVDIGAVEHLHRIAEPPKENDPVELQTFSIHGVPTTDSAVVQKYIEDLEKAGAPAPHKFRIAGAEVTDPAEVQKKIDAFEQTFGQWKDATRGEFVKDLATKNKIGAPQIDSLTSFAQTLNDEQFAAFRKQYDDAPAAPIFANHGGNPGGGNGGPAPAPGSEPTVVDTDLAVVANFRSGGLAEETIKNTPAYKRLLAAGKNPF